MVSNKPVIADRPSICDVARSAGVSPSCVSNVINIRRPQDDLIGRAVMEDVPCPSTRSGNCPAGRPNRQRGVEPARSENPGRVETRQYNPGSMPV